MNHRSVQGEIVAIGCFAHSIDHVIERREGVLQEEFFFFFFVFHSKFNTVFWFSGLTTSLLLSGVGYETGL